MIFRADFFVGTLLGQGRDFQLYRTRMQGVDAVMANSNRAFARHTHDQFGIGIVLRGGQTSASGRGLVEAVAGDLITVNPGEVHDGIPLNADGRSWSMLYFDCNLIRDHFGDLAEGRSYDELHFPVLRDDRASSLFLHLKDAVTDTGSVTGMAAQSLLFELLDCLVSSVPAEKTTSVPLAVERAKARIDDCPVGEYSLGELAAQSALSRFQFLRAFRRLTGLTPHAYILQKRVHLARRLIGSGVGLAEVSAASGFADQSHMTRAFAARYGITPGSFAAALA